MLKILTDRNFNLKLKTQLIASFLAMTILIVSALSFAVYHSVLSILKEKSEQSVTGQFRQSEYNILSFRDQLEKMMGLLAINNDIQSFVSQPDYPDEASRLNAARQIIKTLDVILSTYPYVYSISLYNRNGEAVSVTVNSSWYSKDASRSSPFYASALYERISRKSNGFLWDGQADSSLFGLAERVYPSDRPIPYMTAVRNVNALGRVNLSAVLAVNVRQEEFVSIYNSSEGREGAGSPYLIDGDGIRISDVDSRLIGEGSPFLDRLDQAGSNGSFMLPIGGRTQQVTYYRVGQTDWTLINETPEAEFVLNTLNLRKLIGIAVAFSILFALLLSVYWIYRITRPFNHLVHAMREMEHGNLGIVLDETPSTELGIIGRRFNKMSMSIGELIEQNRTIEEEKRALELEALQSQINPHFLYNALNTIKWVAMVRKELSIVDSITTLGNMLRAIYKDRSPFITLQDEVEYVHNYLKIMNARYGEGVRVSLTVPDELKACKIIRFMLQPIVENAFVHGMTSKNYQGAIRIAAARAGEDMIIAVSDNGTGMTEERLHAIRESLVTGEAALHPSHGRSAGIGLANVNRRIRMHYGRAYGLSIHSGADEGTRVEIRVPASAR
ncbi:sensor histidine kinase [Cohnella cellulosilytica]